MADLQRAVFTSIGLLQTTQEVAGAALRFMSEADPELVAEETLCLLSAAAARTIEAVSGDAGELSDAVMAAPFLYRDYMVGTAMLSSGDQSVGETIGAEVGRRLERKMSFYASHFPPGLAPGDRQVDEKMLLWMGRISPPKMPQSPEKRLQSIQVTGHVKAFLRLVAAHVRHGMARNG